MGLQYVLIPAVRVYKGATGTMENDPVINQRISTHNAIHLVTSYDITPEESCLFREAQIQALALPVSPKKQSGSLIRH